MKSSFVFLTQLRKKSKYGRTPRSTLDRRGKHFNININRCPTDTGKPGKIGFFFQSGIGRGIFKIYGNGAIFSRSEESESVAKLKKIHE